jgi:hypothetical protein
MSTADPAEVMLFDLPLAEVAEKWFALRQWVDSAPDANLDANKHANQDANKHANHRANQKRL